MKTIIMAKNLLPIITKIDQGQAPFKSQPITKIIPLKK